MQTCWSARYFFFREEANVFEPLFWLCVVCVLMRHQLRVALQQRELRAAVRPPLRSALTLPLFLPPVRVVASLFAGATCLAVCVCVPMCCRRSGRVHQRGVPDGR